MITKSSFLIRVLLFISIYCGVQSTSTNDSVVNETDAALKPVFKNLEDQFVTLKNDELQVSLITNLYGSLSFLNKGSDPRIKLEDLTEKLKNNIDVINAVIERAKSSFKSHNSTTIAKYKQSVIVPCIDDEVSEISDSIMNENTDNSVSEILRILYYDLWGLKKALKKVYFLSLTSSPYSENAKMDDNYCQIDHSKLWKTYMSHNVYKTRRVIVLIDHGNSIEDNLLYLSKLFAKQMISVLNENDKFTIIAIASKWSSLTVSEPCGNQHLPSILTATDNNKEMTYSFIDELSSKNEITDHSVGIKTAMKMARLFYAREETVMLLYISPGMQFSMSEAIDIITITDLSSPLIVNTCSVSSGALPNIQDMNILSNIMNDFFIEKTINNHRISRGHLAFINDPSSIGPAVARFYEMYNSRLHRTTTKVSLPMWDTVSQDLTTTFSIGFPMGNRFIVIGVDLYLSTFLRDIIYYSNYQQNMSTILMDSSGIVLVHSAISSEKLEKQIKFTHISKYLPQEFDTDMFFEKTEGTFISEETSKTFLWKHIDNIYVICMVVNKMEDIALVPSKLNWLPSLANSQLVSYLIDLAANSAVCKRFGKITNIESPSLYLSQNCFQHLSQKTNTSITLNLLPYFQRDSLLIKHEELREGIRDELAGLVQAIDFLTKKHLNSVNADYIIRRYVATKSGIAHMFPGASLAPSFEPSKRLWFLRADEMRGRLIVSPPYLDAGGAGYIVTISFATGSVVLGMDVTYGFILKTVLQQNLDCLNSTCFLVDDRGYLISHPDIINSLENENEPIEQLHIVHKESSVANDLLNHEVFMQKLACSDYTTATIQRYYQLNLSFPDVLTSSVLGEPCVSYSIGLVKDTNIFFGVVKAACPITRTFCPCSVVDRVCLNCGNMEKQECECPCECHIRRSSCSNYTSHDKYKICDTALRDYSPDPIFNTDNTEDIPHCPSLNCESKTSYLSCLGVAGCEWCKKDTFGFSLDEPFCSSMSACFNGVLGGASPYKDVYSGDGQVLSTIRNTGFVLGCIVVFGIVCIVILVCLRSYNSIPRSQRTYLSARQEHLHMSDFHINEDFLEQGNHSDKLLIEEKKRTPLSPYCVTTNYSRPATAADSDHGYSTMTPHDESEHLSLAPVDIDSSSSDRTTPPIRNKAQTTKIPQKNYIIVPVTVHRHVDAS